MPLIIIPCYNEATRLEPDQFINFCMASPDTSFLFVDDGSTDATSSIIESMAAASSGRIDLLPYRKNRGKAEAIRAGILHAATQSSHRHIGYWDADLATPLSAISELTALARANTARLFILGSRVRRMGASIDRLWLRHYFGRVFATIASTILDLPIYDTQCGAKLIDRELAMEIFAQPFISPWLFDVELIARTIASRGRTKAHHIIYEHPLVQWRDVGKSKVPLTYLPKIPYELFRIYHTYRLALSRNP